MYLYAILLLGSCFRHPLFISEISCFFFFFFSFYRSRIAEYFFYLLALFLLLSQLFTFLYYCNSFLLILSYLFVHLPFIIEIPSSIDPLPSFFRNASLILLYTSFLHHNPSLKHLPLIFVTFNLILFSRSLHCFYQEYITNKLFLKYQISDIFLKNIFIFLKLSTKKARSLLKIIKIIILKLPSFVELSLSKKNISSSKMFQKYQLLVFHSPIIIHL